MKENMTIFIPAENQILNFEHFAQSTFRQLSNEQKKYSKRHQIPKLTVVRQCSALSTILSSAINIQDLAHHLFRYLSQQTIQLITQLRMELRAQQFAQQYEQYAQQSAKVIIALSSALSSVRTQLSSLLSIQLSILSCSHLSSLYLTHLKIEYFEHYKNLRTCFLKGRSKRSRIHDFAASRRISRVFSSAQHR